MEGKRPGRPTKSIIRDNLIELLAVLKKATGYELAKWYNELFPEVTMRVIYYHLKKGIDLGMFTIAGIVEEKGDYSWGQQAQKIYYQLGPAALPRGNARINEFFAKKKAKHP